MQEKRMIMEDFGRKPAFASFLPGIAGLKGIPIWCYYVNRGQGVVSFGVEDKDHSIMEFYPAHQAYQNVKRTGFRTFIKIGENCLEPFHRENDSQTMEISMNGVSLWESDPRWGLKTKVDYYILPGESVGALVRRLTLTNLGEKTVSLEVLDGMTALIPYGINQWTIKHMCQTGKAWMQVEDVETGVPYFRVRASMDDTADVRQIEGGNFSLAIDETGKRLQPIVDTENVFGYDTSLEQPVNFWAKGLDELLAKEQNCQNLFPCSFYGKKGVLHTEESLTIWQLIGQVENRQVLKRFLERDLQPVYFKQKQEEAQRLTEELTARVETHTGHSVFDAYCRYTYMDNVLRGGYPVRMPGGNVFYVYARKHGDLERDYNYFSMRPECYSQGNGNFRDVNQNRRCDVSLWPFVGTENIDVFYSLIQFDGYNPLQLDPVTYTLDTAGRAQLLAQLTSREREHLVSLFSNDFTPGQIYQKMRAAKVDEHRQDEIFTLVMGMASKCRHATFGEGYWCDHWTYHLDLIEDYCSIYPDREEELLFGSSYPWYLSRGQVQDRRKRYVKTDKGIRQYGALIEKNVPSDQMWETLKGETIYSTLLEKLLLLCAVKFATLDFYGMGIEMEGGKPGWYDALNGLPGLLGSSMAETMELERLMRYVIGKLHSYNRSVPVMKEIKILLEHLADIATDEQEALETDAGAKMSFWNRINQVKEEYRHQIYTEISGKYEIMTTSEMVSLVEKYLKVVQLGIAKAKQFSKVMPTYFYYEVTSYEEDDRGILPQAVALQMTPLFLEGTVHLLKSDMDKEEKREVYEAVKASDLYDTKLRMYKVNASLDEATYELGRATAFTCGWLENESIWLHMEYKYLLELLKAELYEEFMEAFYEAGVPFLNADVYGRSILENSSFLVSSSNPNQRLHGRGFVARLSGSTAEFLHMWKIMMFGEKPFHMERGELVLSLKPFLPGYLTQNVDEISAMFLGGVKVVYQIEAGRTYVPGRYRIVSVQLTGNDGKEECVSGGNVIGKRAEDVRRGRVKQIRMVMEQLCPEGS